jgi:hypothetical protein
VKREDGKGSRRKRESAHFGRLVDLVTIVDLHTVYIHGSRDMADKVYVWSWGRAVVLCRSGTCGVRNNPNEYGIRVCRSLVGSIPDQRAVLDLASRLVAHLEWKPTDASAQKGMHCGQAAGACKYTHVVGNWLGEMPDSALAVGQCGWCSCRCQCAARSWPRKA